MGPGVEYIERTRSAVRKLFEGIDSYNTILKDATGPFFVGAFADDQVAQAAFAEWSKANKERIALSLAKQREYMAESFAKATLCGSLLQISAKGIELHSTNAAIPKDWQTFVGPSHSAIPYCHGRLVRSVPIGLVIYAGRNQYAHFNEPSLRRVNMEVFSRLAKSHNYGQGILDPAFDLDYLGNEILAANVVAELGWHSYDKYANDMGCLIGSGRQWDIPGRQS